MVTQKKKILIVTFPQGGPFVWAQNLAKHLEKNGYEVKLFHGRYRHHIREQFKYYDIVHSVMPIPHPLTKKYVLTIHGNYKEETSLLAKILYPLTVLFASSTTMPSQFLQNKLQLRNVKIIPNGIDLPEKTKDSYALIGDKPAVGILTNFNFRRKADGLIHLAKIVRTILPEIKLVIGGSGEFFEEYKKKISEIHPNTDFWGHCRKEDLFSQIDIFAYYSLLDNQPLSLLEAMAFGLPVISNQVGAVEEVLTGKLENYIAKTDEDYENTLERLLASPEAREENGQEAKKIAQDFFWEKIVNKFITLYK